MNTTRPASHIETVDSSRLCEIPALRQLRHDVRNQLNAIKLSCALMQRRNRDPIARESLEEIDRAVDEINRLVGLYTGAADAPSILHDHRQV